jgi:hypothetical protein
MTGKILAIANPKKEFPFFFLRVKTCFLCSTYFT